MSGRMFLPFLLRTGLRYKDIIEKRGVGRRGAFFSP